ncbi:hypothetical protein PanWU01x14_347660 [Parasponia andersonii]|uniref:Uncharacterized protein n=1 Tax=Parasponia andersonii TaxID=3476 RepID=A0A2P5ABW3_PARAD|nr:hypothetical protein PanWU01x14_347660 [Parasponia andersonii]
MKKLYRKGTVHPSPPIISDHLSFLPATILTLTAALTPEDREVLAYLISCSNFSSSGPSPIRRPAQAHSYKITIGSAGRDHTPQFNCDCFRCYTSYWVRWGSSPNRQLIHEIIDAFEDELLTQSKKRGGNSKKERRNNKSAASTTNSNHGSSESKLSELSSGKDELGKSESVQGGGGGGGGGVDGHGHGEGEGKDDQEAESMVSEKGSVRRFMSFVGERIWGVWG